MILLLTGLSPPHVCACPKPRPKSSTSYVVVFFVFSELRWEVIVRFVDVDHHCLNFLIIMNKCGHRKVLSKRQVWMSIFHIINFKKKSWTQGSWIFFNEKLILDYYFCLTSGPVFFISNVHHSPPPLSPKGYTIVSLIIIW